MSKEILQYTCQADWLPLADKPTVRKLVLIENKSLFLFEIRTI